MPRIYLSIGTNQGDREANLSRALRELQQALGTAPAALSSVLETPAWGFEGPDFLNCVVCFDPAPALRLTPTRLLDLCQAIERRMGRSGGPEWDAEGRRIYHDRPIDIDILFWGCRHIHTERLTIPHPLMKQRDFVMTPLREIADGRILRAFPEIFERN